MTKFFALADSGEHVVMRSRKGSYSLKPAKTEAKKTAKPRRNVSEEFTELAALLWGRTTAGRGAARS